MSARRKTHTKSGAGLSGKDIVKRRNNYGTTPNNEATDRIKGKGGGHQEGW